MRQGFKSASNSPEEINFSKIFDLFQSRWYFVVISLLISIVLCKLYLRYTKPIFQASASVRVEEDDNLQNFGLMQAFGFGNWTDNIQSEIQFPVPSLLPVRVLDSCSPIVRTCRPGRCRAE